MGAAATLRSLPRRAQVSEIWVLVTADYKQRSAGHRQAAGRGLAGPKVDLFPAQVLLPPAPGEVHSIAQHRKSWSLCPCCVEQQCARSSGSGHVWDPFRCAGSGGLQHGMDYVIGLGCEDIFCLLIYKTMN